MTEQNYSGGCQCGNIQYLAKAAPKVTALCHCTMCRRAHSAPAVAWALFDAADLVFSGVELKQYSSSPDATRGFCPACGTQVSFQASYLPGMIDISIGSLDEPNTLVPTQHYWYEEHLNWFKVADEWPRYDQWPPLEAE